MRLYAKRSACLSALNPSAAKRRQNEAHGASRGCGDKKQLSPNGAKEAFFNNLHRAEPSSPLEGVLFLEFRHGGEFGRLNLLRARHHFR